MPHVEQSEQLDWTQLAGHTFGPAKNQKTAEERSIAIGKLMRPMWGIAWQLANPHYDLAEDLRAHTMLRCEEGRYDPDQGSFLAWCRTVMTNYLITLTDSRKRGIGGSDSVPEVADKRSFECPSDLRTAPFATEDLDRVRKWGNAARRVLLLTQSLLWRKVPSELWEADLVELGLNAEFPTAEFEDMTRAQRNAYLAKVFNVPTNTIHVRMKRWEKHLRSLKFVRELGNRG